jgi:hypothetical protein
MTLQQIRYAGVPIQCLAACWKVSAGMPRAAGWMSEWDENAIAQRSKSGPLTLDFVEKGSGCDADGSVIQSV